MNVVSETRKSPEVLLVEDNLGDVRLAREAFRDVNSAIHLHLASDGVEAMAFLRQQGNYSDAPRPDLIVLDLNLPKMNGREVLAQIKGDEKLKNDSDCRFKQFRDRCGCYDQLQAAGELLSQEAGAMGCVRRHG